MKAMTTKLLLATVLTLQAFPASAQLSGSTFGGIPFWADSALRANGLMRSSELNPVYAVGDFDRDDIRSWPLYFRGQPCECPCHGIKSGTRGQVR